MATEKLSVILELVNGQYKREAREAATATSQIGKAAKTTSGQMTAMERSTQGVTNKLRGFAAGALIGAAAGIAKFGADSVRAASDLEESMNAVNVVFGSATGIITNFGEQAATSAGLAQAEFQQMASVLGSALINAGIPLDEAAEKTIELTQRAADMASVFNTTVPDALGAVQAALRGESDPIEKYGVTLAAAAVDAEAAALGFKKVAGQFDAEAKAAARLSLIMKQTDRVAGDFENTSEGLANQSKILTANMTNLQAQIGGFLTPALAELTSETLDSIQAFGGFLDIIDKVVDATVGSGGAANEARESLDAYSGVFDFLLPNLTVGFAQFNDLNTSIDENTAAAARAMDAARFMADAVKDDLIPVVFESIGLIDRQGTAFSNAAAAADSQRTAMINLANFQASQLSPIGNIIRLQQDLVSAQETLTAAQEDSKTPADELALAQLGVAEAMLAVQGAGLALEPDQIQAFAQLLITQFGYSEQAALDTLAALNLLDGWTGTATFTLEMDKVVSGAGATGNFNTDLVGFAGGGTVPGWPGQPQLVLAHGGETITPAGQTMTSNSRVTNNHFYAPPKPVDLQWMALQSNLETLVS